MPSFKNPIMKKTLFILSLEVTMIIASCKKSEIDPVAINNVSSDYKVLVVDFTATWCPPCGQYGIPAFNKASTDYPYKIVGLGIHSADDIVKTVSAEQKTIDNFYNVTGIPTFVINTKSLGSGNTNIDLEIDWVVNTIASVGVGISKTLEGNTLKINTKTVFFSDLTGTYNLAVYVVEDGILNMQKMSNGPAVNITHNHVFRGSANGAWGETIVSSKNPKGVDGSYSFTIPSDVKNSSNLHVIAVIYKMSGGNPVEVTNCNATNISGH